MKCLLIQGTGPYMAVELLDSTDPTLKQNSAHDLESIFYVLLFICSQYKGPNDQLRQPEDLKEISMPIATWFEPHHRLRDLGDKKRAHLDDIQRRLISKFSTYFTPLGKTISDIFFDVLFPQDPTSRPSADKKWCCSATHSKFLAVLDHVLEPGAGLDENEPTPGTKKRSDLSDPSGSDGIEGSTKCPRLSGDMVKAVPPLRRSTRKRATQTTGAGSSTVKGTTGGGSQGK